MEDIKLTQEEVGIKGSPTYVSKAFRPEPRVQGEIITPDSAQKAAEYIFDKLKQAL